MRLLENMQKHDIGKLIFSSTSCVYLESETPVTEEAPKLPHNPYGQSKLMCEWLIQSLQKSWPNFRYTALRYFNVAGAEPDGSNGQIYPQAPHLIKRSSQAALGKIADFKIYGTDYNTADGTCIRDYVHVKDVALAHAASLNYLLQGGPSDTFNCGYKKGFSVREVVEMMQEISPRQFDVRFGPRRPGDPSQLIADNQKIISKLGWIPQYNDLKMICKSALDWEAKIH